MTYSAQLTEHYGFRTGDRIVVPKSGWDIIQHHAVFFGMANGKTLVAENKEGCLKCKSCGGTKCG